LHVDPVTFAMTEATTRCHDGPGTATRTTAIRPQEQVVAMVTLREAASDGHFRSTFAPGATSTVHGPVHVTWQVDPGSQLTEAWSPTVTVQVASVSQPTMHPGPQEPLQSAFR